MEILTPEVQQLPALPRQALLTLTPREWEVLLHVANDRQAKEIAEDLYLSPKSVNNYKNSISQKLNLQGYRTLARFALRYRHNLYSWYKLFSYPTTSKSLTVNSGITVKLSHDEMDKIIGGFQSLVCQAAVF